MFAKFKPINFFNINVKAKNSNQIEYMIVIKKEQTFLQGQRNLKKNLQKQLRIISRESEWLKQ